MRFPHVIALVFGLAMIPTGSALAEGDAEKGAKVFKKCKACHRVGDKAKNAVGPVLNGIIGRAAGTAEKYKYSKLNRAAGEAGLVWTEEMVFDYLPNPNKFLKAFLKEKGKEKLAKGSTKMSFKLTKEADRKDVIAYLKTFSPAEKPAEKKQ